MANSIVSMYTRYLIVPETCISNALCDISDSQLVDSVKYAQHAMNVHEEKQWWRIVRLRSGAKLEVTMVSHCQYDFIFQCGARGRAHA